MSERDEFLDWVGTRLKDAEIALHNGDAAPRFAIWSTQEPVTILGAAKNVVGSEEIGDAFRWLEGRFSDCTHYSFEIVAAEVLGDMAYTSGFEHVQTAVNGVPRAFTLRATQIYRREDGEWKVVYRHADEVPSPAEPGTTGGLGLEKDVGPSAWCHRFA
ncbi:hypothetical protein GCM10027449_10550 [Sinomonas notoginsengisoli]|uniref:nuclear transport factor 2 family protein n=1 Tax=Sinomonas notoginsengisoli TaxID=1457311 RepID=UPI001F374D0B|nr:nuclear transport factor 2 family protein [Sinomonas notoginsengisoli]